MTLPATPIVDEVWRATAPYLRTRKNDVHSPISAWFAEELLEAHSEADPLVVRTAILMHDSGWSAIDEGRILEEAFSGDWKKSDVRILHEQEGVKLVRQILPELGFDAAVTDEIAMIIDGHDTRPDAHSLNDALMRDADKLWRYTPAGIAIASGWFKKTPAEYCIQLMEKTFPDLHTDVAREIALRELEVSKRMLRVDVL